MNQGFVDLRQNNHLDSDSFWPSFTDIMMVVVIIFLLTSMLLMVKNWELLDQLRNSMAAEQQAEKVIHDTSLENATLEEQLAYAQDEISMLRMQMMQMGEQSNQLAIELENKEKQIVIVLSENKQLSNSLIKNDEAIASLRSKVSAVEDNLSELNIDIEQKNKQLAQDRQKIVIITRERDSQSQQLTALENSFGSLKVKYDKLIKPARTTKGKYIVSVHFERIKGKGRIRFKGPGDSNYSLLSEKQLHKKLTSLKNKHKNNLYVRIIIPEKSGLTYSEAWAFMRGLLQKYDYYYQD